MFSVLPLGCYGSSLEEKDCISFNVGNQVVIDAGGIMSALPKEKLASIRDIVITHSHYDHIKDLPMLADLMVSYANQAFTIHATKQTILDIKTHVFNNLTWPDFTKINIPGTKIPSVQFSYIEPDIPFTIGDFEFLPVSVNHLVESLGFIIRKGDLSIGYSGDTYYCPEFIEKLNQEKNLKALFYETSFPNSLAGIAKVSKHLTPSILDEELSKIKKDLPVYVFHMKPTMLDDIQREIKSIKTEKELVLLKQKLPVRITH